MPNSYLSSNLETALPTLLCWWVDPTEDHPQSAYKHLAASLELISLPSLVLEGWFCIEQESRRQAGPPWSQKEETTSSLPPFGHFSFIPQNEVATFDQRWRSPFGLDLSLRYRSLLATVNLSLVEESLFLRDYASQTLITQEQGDLTKTTEYE